MKKTQKLVAAILTTMAPALFLTAAATPAPAATVIGGSFSFLNYNVAGLPLVHEPPTTLSMEAAATQIGQRIPPYGIVHLPDLHPALTLPASRVSSGDGTPPHAA
jgi:hypothetical protein